MDKKKWILVSIGIIAGTAAGVAGILSFPNVRVPLLAFLKSNEAPAWIQAVGSILAIVAAAVIARNQLRGAAELERRKQAVSDKQKLEVVMALMVRANGLACDITRAFGSQKHEDFDQVSPALMVDTHHALQALPVFEIPHGLLSLDVLTISRGMASLEEGWNDLIDKSLMKSDEVPLCMQRLCILAGEIGSISKDAVDECKKEIAFRNQLLESL